MGLTSRRPAVRSQESGVRWQTGLSTEIRINPRPAVTPDLNQCGHLQQRPAVLQLHAAQQCGHQPPRQKIYIFEGSWGWPVAGRLRVSGWWSSTFRPLETEYFARTLQPRPGAPSSLQLLHKPVCTICPSVISVSAWCAALCKSSYFAQSGWLGPDLRHVPRGRQSQMRQWWSLHICHGMISTPSILHLHFVSTVLVGCPVELSIKWRCISRWGLLDIILD